MKFEKYLESFPIQKNGDSYFIKFRNRFVRSMSEFKPMYADWIIDAEGGEAISSSEAWDKLEKYTSEYSPEQVEKEIYTPDEVLMVCIETANLKYDDACNAYESTGASINKLTHKDAEALIINAYNNIVEPMLNKESKCSVQHLQTSLTARSIISSQEIYKKLVASLSHDRLKTDKKKREYLKYTESCFEMIHELYNFVESKEFVIECFKHLLWQIKRYSYGMNVRTPYMFNICTSAQKIAKSKLFEIIGSKLGGFSSFAQNGFEHFMDEKNHKFRSEHLMIIMDETSFFKDNEDSWMTLYDAIKRCLTETKVVARAYHTQTIGKFDRRYTLCSTTNRSILRMVPEGEGKRRFIEIRPQLVTDNKGNVDKIIDVIKAFNWDAMWVSIDENRELGYIYEGCECYSELLEIQGQKFESDAISDFVNSYNLYNDAGEMLVDGSGTHILLDDEKIPEDSNTLSVFSLYNRFKKYPKSTGMKPNTFYDKLKLSGVYIGHIKSSKMKKDMIDNSYVVTYKE